MTVEENKELVRTFLRSQTPSGLSRAVELLHPDLGWWTVATRKPMGRELFVRVNEKLIAATGDGLHYEVTSITAEDDRVVVAAEGSATVDGVAYQNAYCMIFTIADGKIVAAQEYYDTVLAEKVIVPIFTRG